MPIATKRERTELPTEVPSSINPPDSPFGNPMTGDGSDPVLDDVRPSLPKSKAETELIIKSLLVTYDSIGKAVFVMSPPDGVHILSNAESMADSWRNLLDSDTKLRKRMLRIIQTSGWGAVVSAHLTVALAIAGNHRDKFSHLIKHKGTPDGNAM